MKIESYQFGKMVVDGKTYKNDLVIFPDRIEADWWRQAGHALSKADVKSIITAQPDSLYIGTGKYGMMKVSTEVQNYLKSEGISWVYIDKTDDAVRAFNAAESKTTVGAFHLTC